MHIPVKQWTPKEYKSSVSIKCDCLHDNQLIEHFEYKTNKLFVLSPGALGGQKKREIFFFDKKIQTAFFLAYLRKRHS